MSHKVEVLKLTLLLIKPKAYQETLKYKVLLVLCKVYLLITFLSTFEHSRLLNISDLGPP